MLVTHVIGVCPHQIQELRQKLSKPETTVKVEAASNDATEDRQATVGASANKDGSSDSDSSVVFNDVEASPYSSAVFEQPTAFAGFGGSFMDSVAAAPMCCSSLSSFGSKWQHGSTAYPSDPYQCGSYGFTEEWLAGTDVIGSDGTAGFFSDEHASSLNFSWCASGGADGWD
jgi:homeobox-leucine zipper protein